MTRPQKPPYGSPCNGCGVCCEEELCPIAHRIFGRWEGPCEILEDAGDGRRVCGLLAHPERHVPALVELVGAEIMRETTEALLGVGVGCDAQMEGEPADPAYEARMKAFAKGSRVRVRAALGALIWGFR